MANALTPGDRVYVPCSAFDELSQHDTALYRTEVVEVQRGSVTVKLPKGAVSTAIGSSRVHRDVGILLIAVGDFETESATLDPLAKSILQFCRLLVPDDQVRQVKVRSLLELQHFWRKNQAAYSHVVLVGHADQNSFVFAVDGEVTVAQLSEVFKVRGAPKKLFISLACKTGYQSFGGHFSTEAICRDFLGPFHSVHGAVASQFCQTFLASHLLEGRTTRIAFNHARASVPGGVSFRLWHRGDMHAT